MDNITVITWPKGQRSLMAQLLRICLGKVWLDAYAKGQALIADTASTRHEDAASDDTSTKGTSKRPQIAGRSYLIEYEDFPQTVVARFEEFVANGGEDSVPSFRNFASQEFSRHEAFIDRWVNSDFAKTQVVVPAAELRANSKEWVLWAIGVLMPGRKAPAPAVLARAEKAAADWIAANPTPDLTRFRHYDPTLFEQLGKLNLRREVVQEVFRDVMRRDLEEYNIVAFQVEADRQALRDRLMKTPEYRLRFGQSVTQQAGAGQTGRTQAPALIHLHIPKSAGTSLTRILASNFPEDGRVSLDPESALAFLELPEAQLRDATFIFGHLHHGTGQTLPQGCIYVCALRKPGPRLLSYFHYMKRRTDHPMFDMLNARDMSFGDFLVYCGTGKTDQRPEVDNGQMRRLAGQMLMSTIGDEHRLFRTALTNTFAPNMVFGLTEHFDLLLEDLVSRNLIGQFSQVNENAAPETADFDAEFSRLTADQKHWLDIFTRWDDKLYAICETYILGLNIGQDTSK